MAHAYPGDLTEFIYEQWDTPSSCLQTVELIPSPPRGDPLPIPSVLEDLISTCYQASLLRDEERPVKFRLILQEPESFDAAMGPPAGLHRLIFTEPRPCNQHELRRLSPSTDFYDSLIGVQLNEKREFEIWGVIHSGLRWVQSLYGGSKTFQPLPASLVIHVTSPGRLAICKGSTTLAVLNAGEITCPASDVLDSHWIRSSFTPARSHLRNLHLAARQSAKNPWANIDQGFFRMLKKQVIMRVIGKIRHAHHGGSLLCIPQEHMASFTRENPYVRLKYRFSDEEPRRRFCSLAVQIANALAESYGGDGSSENMVGWSEYLSSKNQLLSQLDEAIFEWAHLVAGLAAVDGAAVMTRRFELVGFGGDISGKLERVENIAMALDLEGDTAEHVNTSGVGTRHHAVYRLCNVLHDVMGMVVSQDGSVQIVKWKNNFVTCWDQVATSIMDV